VGKVHAEAAAVVNKEKTGAAVEMGKLGTGTADDVGNEVGREEAEAAEEVGTGRVWVIASWEAWSA
jgi:hypothetical protein